VHLEQFLTTPPKSATADRWVRHAQLALDQIRDGGDGSAAAADGLRPPLDDRDLSDGDAPVEPRL
jgi:hypothetical protein